VLLFAHLRDCLPSDVISTRSTATTTTWRREHHFGENVWVTRKGAVRAGEGELGIIPGSMGARSYIVRGKGNPRVSARAATGLAAP
jgi:tRNA-splicing ligase RtcB